MADVITPTYAFTLPEVGASDDTWGTKLNANLTKLNTLLLSGFTGGGASAIGVIKSASLPTDIEHNWALKFDGAKNMQLKTAAGVQEGAFGIDAAGGNVFLQRLNSAGTTIARLRLEADGGIVANVGFFKGSASGLTGFTAAQIPNLDASKITSGVFVDARIPNLNASKTTAGVFAAARIPALPFSQITGIVPISQGGTGDNDAAGARTALGANNASNLNAGTISTARLPSDTAATDWIRVNYAAAASGAVGTYQWLLSNGGGDSAGTVTAGSNLRLPMYAIDTDDNDLHISFYGGPSGTWIAMQSTTAGTSSSQRAPGMYMRIS